MNANYTKRIKKVAKEIAEALYMAENYGLSLECLDCAKSIAEKTGMPVDKVRTDIQERTERELKRLEAEIEKERAKREEECEAARARKAAPIHPGFYELHW